MGSLPLTIRVASPFHGRLIRQHRFLWVVIVICGLAALVLFAHRHLTPSFATTTHCSTANTQTPASSPKLVTHTSRPSTVTPTALKASETPTPCEIGFKQTFGQLTDSYRRCLLEKTTKSKWQELPGAITSCLGDTIWGTLNVHLLNNMDDTKLVILPYHMDQCYNNPQPFDCIQITLGVGNDIEAEKKLRNMLPTCRFYGADPVLASGQVFKEIGAYFELAVAAKSGVLEASVLENGVYHGKNVTAITFADMFTKYAKVDHVDYLFIDNEGPEYTFFEHLQPQGSIAKSNVTICQISVEMHGPLQSYGMNETRYDELITATIKQTAFLPFWTVIGGYHTRSYYLNVQDDYCLQTFYKSKFCKKHC